MNGDSHTLEYDEPCSKVPDESCTFLDDVRLKSCSDFRPDTGKIRVVESITEYVAKDENKSKLTYWGTVVHLLIGGMSPTILNLPATFDQVGYVIGFFGSFVVVVFYAYCMHIVVHCESTLCARLSKSCMTYWEVLHHAFANGPPHMRWMAKYAKPVTYAIFISIWGGGNSTYVLLIVENVKSVLMYVYDWEVSDRLVIGWLTLPLVILCWIPNLKVMVLCSLLSNVLNAASIVIILCIVLQDFPFLDARIPFGDFSRLPYFLSIIFITINGTGLILSLKNQMKHPRKFASKFGVVNVAYVPTGALYAIFGLLCYLKYGSDTKETVILNLTANKFGCVVQAMYALAVILFYPLVSYVTFEMLWDEIPETTKFTSTKVDFLLKFAAQTVNALFSIALAFIIPNIALFISLIGSVCVALDSIILPAIIEWLVHWESPSVRQQMKTTILIIFGVSLMLVGFRDSYIEIRKYYCG